MKLLRLSLTGSKVSFEENIPITHAILKVGPPIAELLQLLGKERFCQYLDLAAKYVTEKEKTLF